MRTRFTVCVVITIAGLPLWSQQPPGETRGNPQRGAPSVRETVSGIQERQKHTPPQPIEFELEVLRNERRRTNPQNPGAREEPRWPRPGAPELQQKQGSPSLFAAQTIGTSFTGATLSGPNPTSAFPPDSMGTVGPTQYIVMVNNRIVSFNKTTGVADGVLNATTN